MKSTNWHKRYVNGYRAVSCRVSHVARSIRASSSGLFLAGLSHVARSVRASSTGLSCLVSHVARSVRDSSTGLFLAGSHRWLDLLELHRQGCLAGCHMWLGLLELERVEILVCDCLV